MFIKFLLFLISYIPLYVIVLVNSIATKYYNLKPNKNPVMYNLLKTSKTVIIDTNFGRISSSFIAIPAIFLLFIMIFKITRDETSSEKAKKLKTTSDTIVSYLMTYIIPFTSIGLNSSNASLITSLLLFFTVMILFLRLDVVYLNPPLILIGYNIFTNMSEDTHYVTRNSLVEIETARLSNSSIETVKLTNGFYFIKKIEKVTFKQRIINFFKRLKKILRIK